MPGPYGIEIRQRAMELSAMGWTNRAITKALGIGECCVRRWKRLEREHGSIEPLPMGGSTSKIDAYGEELMLSAVNSNCDITLEEMRDVLAERADLDVSKSAVDRAVHRLELTRKKKTHRLTGEDQERYVAQRKDFEAQIKGVPVDKLVFCDEFGANLMMDLAYGRAPKGERAYAPRPTRRGKKN